MRMWMVDVSLLCRKHLLGEHGEIHKHKHSFEKGHSIKRRVSPIVQIEPISMQARHDELAAEITRRNYNHKSPYTQPDVSYIKNVEDIKVDTEISYRDLISRCPECAEKINIHNRSKD